MSRITKQEIFDSLRRWQFERAYELYMKSMVYEMTPDGWHRVYLRLKGKEVSEEMLSQYLYTVAGWSQRELLDELHRREGIVGQDIVEASETKNV